MCILHKREKWKFALGSSVESASRIRQKPARRFRRETFSSPRSGTSRRKTADGNTQMHVPITGSRPRNPRITAHGNDIPLRHATGGSTALLGRDYRAWPEPIHPLLFSSVVVEASPTRDKFNGIVMRVRCAG